MKPFLIISYLVILLVTASAQTPAPSPSAAPPACTTPEFHQFDFWIGKWNVTNKEGKQIGTSEISRVSEGCAVREQWLDANAKGGTSLNYYDPADKQWHQDWVGGDDTILHIHGGWNGHSMVLSGKSTSSKGPFLSRLTYTPSADGKVTQEWAISTDKGSTWQTNFVGYYTKRP